MAFSALLDACVLVPSVYRDVTLEAASRGVFRPLWSEAILDELGVALQEIRGQRGLPADETSAYIDRLLRQMAVAFPDAMVSTPPALADLALPDPDDTHVVEAAVAGRADLIVTDNLSDFPASLLPGHLETIDRDAFLLDALDLRPDDLIRSLTAVSSRRGRHGEPQSVDDLLAVLQNDVPAFTAAFKALPRS